MPFKPVSSEMSQALLTPYIGQKMTVKAIRTTGEITPHHIPATTPAEKKIIQDLRTTVHEKGIVLQLHLDKMVMTYLPPLSQRQTTLDETLVLDVYIVKCAGDIWRLSPAPDIQPKDPVENLVAHFRAGNKKDIAVKKPLTVKKRPSP